MLKEDGILIFAGNIEFAFKPGVPNLAVNIKNPVIKIEEGQNLDGYSIDIPRLLAEAGFKQGKPLREMENYEGGIRLRKAKGGMMIASKSNEPIDFTSFSDRFPAMNAIMSHFTHELYQLAPSGSAKKEPNDGSEPSPSTDKDQVGPSFRP